MEGFEPTLCYNGLQNRSLRPLGHISIILVRKVGVEPTSVPITFGLLRRQGGYLRIILERHKGFEPLPSGWKPTMLPLNTNAAYYFSHFFIIGTTII
jgi:hypothetical protein